MEIIIRTHCDRNIINELMTFIPGPWPVWINNTGCDSIRYHSDSVYSDFSYGSWGFYCSNKDYNDVPRYDARIQMAKIKSLFMKKEQAEEKPKLEPRKRLAIDISGSQHLSNMVQRVAFAGGYAWGGSGCVVMSGIQKCLLFGWNDPNEKIIYHGSSMSAEQMVKSVGSGEVMDASKDMDKIMMYFLGSTDTIPEMIVSGQLIRFIKLHPEDEMTAGFIRRDVGLVLPEDIQKQGADAILKWLVDSQKKIKLNEPVAPQEFEIKLRYSVSGRNHFSREDTVLFREVVPPEVVEQALSEDDPEPIRRWFIDNRGELDPVDTDYGEEEIHDSDSDDEFEGVASDRDIVNKLKQLKEKRNG